ncbi:MAG: DM13 domain-containing protein [bacterium]|nr:DM13 domain-containing protein [bacterium]
MNKKILISVGVVVALSVAYYLVSPLWRTVALNEELPSVTTTPVANQPAIISRASMIAEAHSVSGEALIVKSGNETFLRFENLKTTNGPDLHIYLSAGLGVDDAVDLGAIRATEGNVNYPIPAGTDLNKYKNALIWCRPFRILFSYAQL